MLRAAIEGAAGAVLIKGAAARSQAESSCGGSRQGEGAPPPGRAEEAPLAGSCGYCDEGPRHRSNKRALATETGDRSRGRWSWLFA